MYCSDCHGTNTANGGSAPASGKPWGPHGSENPFILKGPWEPGTAAPPSDTLCFKCHNIGYRTGSQGDSGFHDNDDFGSKKGDLHAYHADKITPGNSTNVLRCNWCHVAVPHGWKNKAFLVNLNDVGPECEENGVRLAVGTNRNPGNNGSAGFTCAPYYQNAYLRVVNWRRSGEWRPQDCGVNSNDNDVDWMKNTCQDPP
nr:cytochrome c3 family protein [Motiliproteus sediminis]